MAAPLQSSMPQFTQLGNNTSVFLEAVDPTTGAAVTGVVVSAVEIWADITEGAGSGNQTVVGPYMLVAGPSA